MSTERWQRIERIYLAAQECGEPRRAALLDEACAGDADLRREVEALLAQEPFLARFLETPPRLPGDAPGPSRPGGAGGSAGGERRGPEPATGVTGGAGDEDLASPPLDAAGLFAGRYRVLRLLGRGGMGVVYQAEDVRLRRFVALKFLASTLASQPQARARFLREAQAAAALDDPHVCTVFEVGEHQGCAYLAMAFTTAPR